MHPARPASLDQLPTSSRVKRLKSPGIDLETGRRNREFKRITVRAEIHQPEDEATSEAIPSPTRSTMLGDFIMAADKEFLTIVQAGRPAVVGRADGFTEGHGDRLQIGIV